ncbi:hypothetical protein BWQ96_04436 [Gracilariopsis chorda]|uniref:Uncharacterized protein n=1 Tax=Gracilariopsis chorda TaxID=448386 RepID=A0A2V3IUM7_9FLOR|nr:hypothetical protein BWQ96_04436 [Gracilariopsis chorda]|eukprot:PXF45824.1 hypothetical protein BWQ96_04436 [Gracilariopsis chorda]
MADIGMAMDGDSMADNAALSVCKLAKVCARTRAHTVGVASGGNFDTQRRLLMGAADGSDEA